jgi:Rad3-related DNA helicase
MILTDELFKKIFPFDTPRKNQREIIEFVIKSFESGKKHVILNCPTGTGKSAIAYSVAAYFEKAFILTSQKILQDQYFKELNVPYILGKSNYKCQKNDELTCEFGMCGTSLKGKCSDCPYTIQKALALNNWICNLNYSYFFNIIKTKKVPARTLMVLDECHSVENELINTSTLKLNEKLLNFLGLYNISLPDNDSDNYAKINWLTEIIMPKLVNQYLYFKNQLDQFDKFNFTQEFKKSIGKFQVLERMLSIINSIKEQTKNGQRIIVNLIDKKEIEFKVLFGNKLFENNLAPMGKYFLHMSATVLSKEQYCKNLGINPNDVVYYSCDSLFPV